MVDHNHSASLIVHALVKVIRKHKKKGGDKKKMKYVISTDSDEVSPHFGRAPQFNFIRVENNKILEREVLSNPGHSLGSLPKFINEKNANVIITGGMGRRAIDFFEQYGIEVVLGVKGKIDDVIKSILDGTLKSGESSCFPGAGKGYGVEKIHTEANNNHEHHPPHM